MNTLSGLDVLLADPKRFLKGRNIGLALNHTSIARDGRSSVFHFQRDSSFDLRRLFAPEHGLYGTDQDMVGVAGHTDPASGLEVASLYGDRPESLTPGPQLLEDIDTLVFDIQDVGSRYYTFIYTLANCMRACQEKGIPIVVCDRPNPINGVQVEGNLVGEAFRSFVGQYPIPNRHGMTVGELAMLFNGHFGIGCNLAVVPMRGWKREMWHDETGLSWVPPSPNMPTLAAATVYPGMCLVEGSRLSEGRGTTLPFELCGAPYVEAHDAAEKLNREGLPGVWFRPHYFKPVFHKGAGKTCGGVQLHVVDRRQFKPVLTGIAVLMAIARLYPGDFAWRTEPYEFENERLAIDLLYGNSEFRESFLNGRQPLAAIEDSWRSDLNAFMPVRQDCLLY